MSKIVRRVDFVHKIIIEKIHDITVHEFGHRLIMNYNFGKSTSSYSLTIQIIEEIL